MKETIAAFVVAILILASLGTVAYSSHGDYIVRKQMRADALFNCSYEGGEMIRVGQHIMCDKPDSEPKLMFDL